MTTYRPLPTLTQLRHLIAVADHGHFGRAAEACFITQSSLSASIKELETMLGRVLIERTRRSVMMTALGLDVVRRARKAVVDVGDIVDLVSAAGGVLSGPLRLGVIPTIAPFLLPRVMGAVRKAHPELKLYLREEQTARLLKDLRAGDLDLLLMAFPYSTEDLETLVFADDPFWVAFPKGHWCGSKERVSIADLEAEQLMLLGEGHCLRDHALGLRARKAAVSIGEFQASSIQTLVQMVDNGLGLTVLPKMAIDAGITRGTRVQVRPLDGTIISRQIGFVWRASSSRRDDFARLGEFFRDELATPLSPRRKRAGTGKVKGI
ncbi:MAG: hydrogen peroxide-inducible genes activator [Alphaproteobacteria bacterium]|jgi:LysR family transcriptional regulator, hydrogen peroxide-inducible genes activator|nr:hydrogen peroxide-inducible genes activator [Alphaproteobacteria bacterium]